MPEKVSEPGLPSGIYRAAFRLPIWLYQIHLGWLLGCRFVLLTHTGRKSGRLRQTVLEVVRYDNTTGGCVVASGWGTRSDWFQNVCVNPKIQIQVGNRRSSAAARRLLPEEAAEELLDYARRNPLALRELAKFMGYRIDGSDEDIRALGKEVPMFFFSPLQEARGG